MKSICIIIPIYNVEKYLVRCLNSVANQIGGNFKAILVDDGSTDRCGQICDEYAMQDERFIVLHKNNGGLVSAVKYGIVHSPECDYYMFLDGDDVLDPTALESLSKVFSHYAPDMVMYDFFTLYNSGKKKLVSFDLSEGYYNKQAMESIKLEYINHKKISPTRWNKLIRTDIVKRNLDLYDERVNMAEDMLFTTLNFFDSENFFYLNKPLMYYCQNSSSMIHNYKPFYWDSYKTVYQNLLVYFGDDILPNKIFFIHIKNAIQFILLGNQSDKDKKNELYRICSDDQVISLLDSYVPFGIKNKFICLMLKKRRYKFMLFVYRIRDKCLTMYFKLCRIGH